jgi:diacylglycerol kinase family enzyme
MAAQHRRATLIHNEKAGDRRHCRAGLVELLQRAGYRVDFFSVNECDLAEAVGHPADLIVVAGGDGTVAKIVAVATPEGQPIAILPLGTANNIATSLGIGGAPEEIVASWAAPKTRPLYPIAADGPWGTRRLAEGIGFGAFEQAISELPHKPGLQRARQAIRAAVLGAAPESLEIGIDGETFAGRFAVVEIAAIPLIGPRLPLAPAADPSDRCLDVCFIGDSGEERQRLARWLDDPEGGGRIPVSVRRGQQVTIRGQFRCVRLDSKLWSGEPGPRAGDLRPPIDLATEPRPLQFLVPG